MNISKIFIHRPVMTTLVMLSILFFGIIAYYALPVSNLPNINYPTIQVETSYPGANPETIAENITSPLEKKLTSIDGVQTIVSSSQNGHSTIILQFDLNKNIDSAAIDIQAAIHQAQPNLPKDLPSSPIYRKINPARAPILYLAISSSHISPAQLYEYADSLIGQRLGMIKGVAEAQVYGSPFAIRVQVDPDYLSAHQIGINEVANAIVTNNPKLPLGHLYNSGTKYVINVNKNMSKAEAYNNLIIRNNKHALLRIKDVGHTLDSLQNDKYSLDFFTKQSKQPSVVIAITKQADANTIQVTKQIKASLETMKWELPPSIDLNVMFDQSQWIMESIHDIQFTLIIALLLVIFVILFYIGKIESAITSLLSLPISVISTFAVIYLLGFNIDMLSLLAITLSIGFLIDDTIVVIENINRHSAMGLSIKQAALNGSKQISFTVLSMTLSLASVFIPMIFIGGIVGRIFREFAMTIVSAVLISGFISLSLIPMLCSRITTPYQSNNKHSYLIRLSERINTSLLNLYKRGLHIIFKHRFITLLSGVALLIGTICLTLTLPTDFIPPDDLGFIQGFALGPDQTSPYKMIESQRQLSEIIRQDPNVQNLVSAGALPSSNQSLMFIKLKPQGERMKMSKTIQTLLEKLHHIPGTKTFLRSMPLINLDVGMQMSMGHYQYVLQGLNRDRLYQDAQKIINKMRQTPDFMQVMSNMCNDASYLNINIDLDRASDLNISTRAIEESFQYAYSGGALSVINGPTHQYHVILETIPTAYQDPSVLNKLYISSNTSHTTQQIKDKSAPLLPTYVPLFSLASWNQTTGPLSIFHLNTLPSVTISYDLAPGVPLSVGLSKLNDIASHTLSPETHTTQIGATQVFKHSFHHLFFLLIITIFIIYVILGILYENFIHPITVISTLPPAAFGAVITLILFRETLSLYVFVGMIMLLGIVLKNGIMLVDFANEGIKKGMTPYQAIYEACIIRFRPILMTTLTAMMGAMPIALGIGGSTALSRRPLGLVIVGGLIISQVLTLYFTPITFNYLENLRQHINTKKKGSSQ